MAKIKRLKYRKLTTQQVWKWPGCGFRLFKKYPLLWIVTAFCFMLTATALGMIPIVGSILVMLIAPIVFSSSLLWLASPEMQKGRHKSKTRDFNSRLKQTLYGAMTVQENIVPILIIGAFLAVTSVIIQILGNLIAGPLFPSLVAVLDLSPPQIARILSAKLVILLLEFFVAMWVFYALPIVILENVVLTRAVMKSFRGILANSIGILGLYFATLFPLILWSLFFSTADPVGFLGFVVIGTCLLAVFINSAYCGYKLTFYR